MGIKSTATYTKEQIIRFNHTYFFSRKANFFFLGICTAFVLFCFLLIKAYDPTNSDATILLLYILGVDALYFGLGLGRPYLAVRRSTLLNLSVNTIFPRRSLRIQARRTR